MSWIWRDLAYGARVLMNRPGFTGVAVATMALGIGANTAIFSVVNTVLLGSVPFEAPQRLVYMGEHSEQIPTMSVSYPNFLDWESRNRSFESIAAHNYASVNLTGLDVPEVLLASRVSSTLFAILRTEPVLGRAFTEEEDRVGGERVCLVSYEFWQTRLGGSEAAAGRQLQLSGEPWIVIGVMPQGFLYPISNFRPDVWMPIEHFAENWLEARGSHPGIYVTGRLGREVTHEQARADMESIAVALEQEYPDSNTGNRVSYSPLTDRVVRNARPSLLVLMGAVALVLLIACVNVANLLLARGMSRQREIAVRAALGSGKWQLVRQLLTESMLLAAIAGGFGLLIGWGALAVLERSIDPEMISAYRRIELDGTVLLFNATVSIVTGLLFGLLPALQLLRSDITGNLKDGVRGSSSGQRGIKNALVVSEVALAFVLLVGALLFIQSFRRLSITDPGFEDTNVLTMSINLPTSEYPEPAQQSRFFQQLLLQVRSLPGVERAATTMPLLGGWQNSIIYEGQQPPAPGESVSVDITRVSPGYFETMGLELLRGRVLTDADREDALRVAVVDRTLAERFWPGEDPLGRRIKLDSDPASENPWIEVVGVVNHVKNYGVAQPSRIEIYVPSEQSQVRFATLVLKSSGDPTALIASVKNEVLNLDPNQPVSRVRTLEETTASTTGPQRMAATVLGVFSGVALLLAAIGIYGVMAYSVAERRQEIGIRMAMGATASKVLAMVVGQGLKLAAIGVAAGLLIAVVMAPALASVLFEVDPRDPVTLAVLPLVLGAIAFLATVIPAIRATRVPPTTVLRYE